MKNNFYNHKCKKFLFAESKKLKKLCPQHKVLQKLDVKPDGLMRKSKWRCLEQ